MRHTVIEELTRLSGDQGFEMVLSSYVPHIMGDNIERALEPLFAQEERLATCTRTRALSAEVPHWAVHPGGRAGGRDILDRIQDRVGLTEPQLAPARETLGDFGNMSSATVLFVLKNILQRETIEDGDRLVALAFGPALTVESGLFTVLRD